MTGKDLFGRKAELTWLDECWERGVRVASIVAWGGVGKSALVNAWLRRMDEDGWRGAERVFGWSFYSQGTDRLSSSDEFIDVALRWFGDPDSTAGSPWDKGERLAALVRRERVLLILDGVEPLQSAPGIDGGRLQEQAMRALVKELGAQNRGLCLITTRIGVTDLEEWGGDKVCAKDLGHLSPQAGAELLKARGAKGTEEELREAATEYKGHGLALTLLGSYLDEACEGDVLRRHEIGPLEEDERWGHKAHRVMAAYEHWFDGGPEVGILKLLGLFDQPADRGEIEAVRDLLYVRGEKKWYHVFTGAPKRPLSAQAWDRAVARLRRVSLLAADAKNNEHEKLDAHPLVREHFGEQLKREQPEVWREGHRRLYEHLKGKAKYLPETIEEMAPLYAAVVHGCLAGKNQEARREVFMKRIQRVDDYFSVKRLGAFGNEVAALSAFFDPPWERLAPGLSKADGALVLSQAGFALRAVGRLPEAAGLMRMALDLRIAQGNWKEAALCASNLSQLLQARGELSDALVQARKSVVLADKSGKAIWRMLCRTDVAAGLHAMGLREEAAAQFAEAERMHSLPGYQCYDLLLDQGRDADVRELAAQTLERAKAHLGPLPVALDHLFLGRAHLLGAQRGAAGDLAQAASHLAASVDGLRRAGTQHQFPLGLLARAALHTHTRAFDLARTDLTEALTLATRCGFRLHEADAHLGLARLALAEGTPAAATGHLTTARTIITTTGYHRRDEELKALEAEAASRRG